MERPYRPIFSRCRVATSAASQRLQGSRRVQEVPVRELVLHDGADPLVVDLHVTCAEFFQPLGTADEHGHGLTHGC